MVGGAGDGSPVFEVVGDGLEGLLVGGHCCGWCFSIMVLIFWKSWGSARGMLVPVVIQYWPLS